MMPCLLESAEQHLMRKLNLTSDIVSIRADAKPSPVAGELFVAVHGINIGPNEFDLNSGVDISFDLGVTVTKRIRFNPYDVNVRNELLANNTSLAVLLHKCMGWLHQNYDVMNNATTLVRKLMTNAVQFIEPLRFQAMDSVPTFVGEEWFKPEFSADAAIRIANSSVRTDATYPYAAMVMGCTLGGCRRTLSASSLLNEVTNL